MRPEDGSENELSVQYVIPAQDRLTTYPVRKAKRPPPDARCNKCGSALISALPTFSAGSGVANCPFAEDVICNQCGHIGPLAI